MPDPLEELRDRLQQESAESDAKLRQVINEEVTDERLRQDWDRLRGTHRSQTDDMIANSRLSLWRELLVALWTTRDEMLQWLRPFSLKVVLPVAALAALVIFVLLPSGFVSPADPGERGFTPGQPALPDQVRVDFKKGRIEFFGGGDLLSGTMTSSAADSTPAIAAFQVEVKGKDATGLAGEFSGKILFTRSEPGRTPAQRSDVKKIMAAGELRVTGAGAYQVKRTYLP